VNPLDDSDLDRQLKDAFNPDRVSVERIVTKALGAPVARRRNVGRLVASIGAAAFVVALIVLNWPPKSRPPDPIRMRNVGEVILVDFPDGSRAVIGPAKSDPDLFAGFDYVLVQGERQ
jgi:hypothetical protein